MTKVTPEEISERLADNRKWLIEKLKQDGDVKCGACSACCYNKSVFLYTEAGDRPWEYLHIWDFNEYWFAEMPRLKHRPDGGCVYLGAEGGCTIWERRPAACRAYSCVSQYLLLSRMDRKRLKREGKWTPALEAGERHARGSASAQEKPDEA